MIFFFVSKENPKYKISEEMMKGEFLSSIEESRIEDFKKIITNGGAYHYINKERKFKPDHVFEVKKDNSSDYIFLEYSEDFFSILDFGNRKNYSYAIKTKDFKKIIEKALKNPITFKVFQERNKEHVKKVFRYRK